MATGKCRIGLGGKFCKTIKLIFSLKYMVARYTQKEGFEYFF